MLIVVVLALAWFLGYFNPSDVRTKAPTGQQTPTTPEPPGTGNNPART